MNVDCLIKGLIEFFAFYSKNRFYLNFFRKQPLFVYIGCPYYTNIGDQMLYLSISNLLHPVKLTPGRPVSFYLNTRLSKIISFLFQLFIKGIGRYTAVILGGGTLINEFRFSAQLKYHFQSGLPLIIFGTGLQDLDYFGSGSFLKEIEYLNQAEMVWVRDHYAQKQLAKFNINAKVMGDPALFLCRPIKGKRIRRIIGINIFFGGLQPLPDVQASVNDTIGNLVEDLITQGYKVIFFAMNQDDIETLEKIKRQFNLGKVPLWKNLLDIEGFLKIINSCDLIISQRLHGSVAASGLGIPTISLSYDPKCLHFMESIDQEKYCLNINDLEFSKLKEKVIDIYNDYYQIRNELIKITDHYRKIQREASKEVLSRIFPMKKTKRIKKL